LTVPEWLTSKPFAHRGLFDNETIPENSLAAFELAISGGHSIELDVRLTADGKLCVFHDASLLRMTSKEKSFGASEWSGIEGLKLLGTNQTVPRLETALELIGGRVPVLVEIKNAGISNKVSALTAEVLDRYTGAFAVQSFNGFTVNWFKKYRPDYCCGQLATGFRSKAAVARRVNYLFLSFYLSGLTRPEFIAYDIEAGDTAFFETALRASGLPLLLWIIDSEEKLAMCRKLKVNYIFEQHLVDMLPSAAGQ
jgi:glycerophosphoryl diester phosphodiesterase